MPGPDYHGKRYKDEYAKLLREAKEKGLEPVPCACAFWTCNNTVSLYIHQEVPTNHAIEPVACCAQHAMYGGWAIQRREMRRRDRARKKAAYVPVEPTPRDCEVCGTEFTAKRADARCCSGKCRTKLWRSQRA